MVANLEVGSILQGFVAVGEDSVIGDYCRLAAHVVVQIARDEQALVAALVRGHRRKFDDSFFESLPLDLRITAMRLCAVLRLAVLLNRNRDPDIISLPHLSASENKLTLTFSEEWLATHPLARADLEREQRLIKPSGLKLTGFEED